MSFKINSFNNIQLYWCKFIGKHNNLYSCERLSWINFTGKKKWHQEYLEGEMRKEELSETWVMWRAQCCKLFCRSFTRLVISYSVCYVLTQLPMLNKWHHDTPKSDTQRNDNQPNSTLLNYTHRNDCYHNNTAYSLSNAMPFGITPFSITAFGITTHNIATLIKITLCIVTLSRMTISPMTLGKMTLGTMMLYLTTFSKATLWLMLNAFIINVGKKHQITIIVNYKKFYNIGPRLKKNCLKW